MMWHSNPAPNPETFSEDFFCIPICIKKRTHVTHECIVKFMEEVICDLMEGAAKYLTNSFVLRF